MDIWKMCFLGEFGRLRLFEVLSDIYNKLFSMGVARGIG